MSLFVQGAQFQFPTENGTLVQLAAGDLNGDGFPDLVAAWEVGVGTQDQPIQILLGTASGGFVDGSSLVSGALPTVAHPQQIVLADFQGDGKLDIFVADHGYDANPFPGHQQVLMEWTQDGELHDVSSTALPQELSFTHRVAVGDIYGNGSLDLFYANLPGSGNTPLPQLLVNNGTGNFTLDQGALPSSVTMPGAIGNTGALLADLNGDGKADLVLGGWDPLHTGMHPCVLYLNNGNGQFSSSTPIVLPAPAIPLVNGIGPTALDIETADLTGDGRQDLVIDWTNGNYTSHYYQILINQGNGQFVDETQQLLPQTIQQDYWTVHIYLEDLGNNGIVDLITQPISGAAPTVYLNDGTGHFSVGGTFGQPGEIIAPVYESGHIDFAAVVGGNGIGNVYLNTFAAAGSVSEQKLQDDYLAITRIALPFDEAQSAVHAISSGLVTEENFITGFLSAVANTTIPVIAVEASMYGAVGSSAVITSLVTNFLPGQLAYANQVGLDPQTFACLETALVFAFANESGSTAFANNFGPSNAAMPATAAGDMAFAAAATNAIFGSAQTANTAPALLGYVHFLEGFFTANGIVGVPNATPDQIVIAARAGAWGEGVAIAEGNNLGPFPGQTTNFLEDAAQGTAIYSASLSSQPTAGPFQGAAATAVATTADHVQVTGIAAPVDHAIM